MDKRRYFARKIMNALLTIALIASFNFVLFRILPGDPARLLVPKGRFSMDAMAKQRANFHLNKPLWEQFVLYWGDTVRLKFGDSFAQKRPVAQVVGERIWPTVLLVGTGTIIATIIGVITGVFAGWRRNSRFDVGDHQRRHGHVLRADLLDLSDLHHDLRDVVTLVPGRDACTTPARPTRAGSTSSARCCTTCSCRPSRSPSPTWASTT